LQSFFRCCIIASYDEKQEMSQQKKSEFLKNEIVEEKMTAKEKK